MEDQKMIQAFSPHAPQKAFTDGICSWRPIRRSQHLDACCCCHTRKTAIQICGHYLESDIVAFVHMESPPAVVVLPRDRWAIASHSHGSPSAISVR